PPPPYVESRRFPLRTSGLSEWMASMLRQCLPASCYQEGTKGCVQLGHGPRWGYYDVAGRAVPYIREHFRTALNIPEEAAPLVNGVPVGEDYETRAGDVVDFIRVSGQKGLGELIPADQLMAKWGITKQQYQELLEMGLPRVIFKDGSICHPEVAVDAWFRQA